MMHQQEFGSDRKDQHVGLASLQYKEESPSDLTETRFVHQSLPELSLDQVDVRTCFAGFELAHPFYINAMTGGSAKTGEINRTLGILAHYTGVPIAAGSLSAAMKDPNLLDTFSVLRKENPKGLIFANLGAHHGLDNAKRAVAALEANALQIHVNAPQEIVMPEGDRDFSMWLKNIETLVRELEVPVIVKEVGFGMSRETVSQLQSVGVKTIDISGTGGTDFAKIENARRSQSKLDFLEGWGQSTLVSTLEALEARGQKELSILASGGVKTSLDIVKLLAVGADAVGMSNRILQLVKDGDGEHLQAACLELDNMKEEIRAIVGMLGAKNLTELRTKDLILAPKVQNWCEARGIDWKAYANRSCLKK
ncbi:TPA: type 2 isopentenyl-diphosphate Delta-isomerase [Streptococcus suis]